MQKLSLVNRLKAVAVGASMLVCSAATAFSSGTAEVSAASNYNLAKALQYSLYFYDANMCGTGVDENCALTWRSDCHTSDAAVSTPYGTLDLSGGYHDAGDHVKFGLPQAYSAVTLGWSYYEYEEAFTSTGQDAHAKVILDYFADYFKRCTVMQNGSVVAFCYQVGDGNEDHNYWGPPEDQTGTRKTLFATSSNPGTDIVTLTAAALAANYVNFGDAEDLTYAKALYKFAQDNNKAVASEGIGGFYDSSDWRDDMAFAAGWLYKATNDSSYQTEGKNLLSGSNYANTTTWAYCWNSVWPGANALLGDWSTVRTNLSSASGSNYYFADKWGSARYNTAMQFVGLVYDKYNNSSTYTSWSLGQMEYILGSNPLNRCYMVGYSDNSVKYPHHRAASGYTTSPQQGDTTPQKYVLVGALASGPEDANGSHTDTTDNYVGNEVAIDYNAAFVGALAALYLEYGQGQQVDSEIAGVKSASQPVETTEETTAVQTTVETTETTIVTQDTVTETSVVTTSGSTENPVTGENTVIVNTTLDKNSDDNKTVVVPLSELMNPGDTVKAFIVKLEANESISNFQGAYGFSVVGTSQYATETGWYQNNSYSPDISGTSPEITISIDAAMAADIAADGNFMFGIWWSNQQYITVKSISAIVESPAETTAETTVTQTQTTTVTTTESETQTTTVTTTESETETTKVTTTESETETTKITTTESETETETEAETTQATSTDAETETEEAVDWGKVEYGDVNLNGIVDLFDVIDLNKSLVGSLSLNATARENANCADYSKGEVDVFDSVAILKAILGLMGYDELGPQS